MTKDCSCCLNPLAPMWYTSCFPPCGNGGSCDAAGTCKCSSGWVGVSCEVPDCGAPPVVPHAVYSPIKGGEQLQLYCDQNYKAVYKSDSFTSSFLSTVSTNFSTSVQAITLTCNGGKFIPTDTELKLKIDFKCEPVCSQLCLHGGRCKTPTSCDCPALWMGAYCHLSSQDECLEDINEYVAVKGTITKDWKNDKLVWLECETGFKIREEVFKAPIYCAGGFWVFEKVQKLSDLGGIPPCLPDCKGGCNGICYGNNACIEMSKICDNIVVINGKSTRRWVVKTRSSNYQTGRTRSLVYCDPGKVLEYPYPPKPDYLRCSDGLWAVISMEMDTAPVVPHGKSLTCVSECERKCSPNGRCENEATKTCKCKLGFEGNTCSQRSCIGAMPTVTNSFSNAKVTSEGLKEYDIQCFPGYEMKKGLSTATGVCQNRVWMMKHALEGIFPVPEQCYPVCDVPCQNNGTCTAPGHCSCPGHYFGFVCQFQACEEEPVSPPHGAYTGR
ncbi:EGF-like domain [Trinorchestia longiramus]|nr:EGF-like domain [Trinorchestia longiramus]